MCQVFVNQVSFLKHLIANSSSELVKNIFSASPRQFIGNLGTDSNVTNDSLIRIEEFQTSCKSPKSFTTTGMGGLGLIKRVFCLFCQNWVSRQAAGNVSGFRLQSTGVRSDPVRASRFVYSPAVCCLASLFHFGPSSFAKSYRPPFLISFLSFLNIT